MVNSNILMMKLLIETHSMFLVQNNFIRFHLYSNRDARLQSQKSKHQLWFYQLGAIGTLVFVAPAGIRQNSFPLLKVLKIRTGITQGRK